MFVATMGNGYYEKCDDCINAFHQSCPMMMMAVDQSGYLDYNSKASAIESMANNKMKLLVDDEYDHGREIIIDSPCTYYWHCLDRDR